MNRLIAAAFALLLALACTVHAAENKQFQIQPATDAWRASLPHDADKATQAYMDRLPQATVDRANAYFEGGYWLILWNFLVNIPIAWLMLAGRRAARIRDWASRVGRRPFAADAIVGIAYWIAAWLLALPLTIYQFFVREHQYGMATQDFTAWFGEQLIGLAVALVVVTMLVPVLYRLIRRFGERWWVAAAVLGIVFQVLTLLVTPEWVDPLFNTYKPVEDPVVKQQVLAMAHANGVPADNIYEVDASRQTTRVSANVSGIFGSAQVRLNDNLLRRTSLAEIRAVMGHELGHYVLNHQFKILAYLALMFIAGFALVAWIMRESLARWGERWGLQGVGDIAGLPLLVMAFSVFFFVTTPLLNTMVRVHEIEADRFGLNLSREPLGEAEVDLKLTEYRKPDPGPIEEFIFFDHPSTRFRIHDAMQWREAMQADGPDKPWPAAKK
ncbi:MAG TPA: M48 family metallopeptidase [Ramlibacter sp.]|nr:M48 family metallopeptidase [Ramlibacter sp.]